MLLPPQFWVPHGDPLWKGGVERALMSTTADKNVALHYANGRGTVVEIDVGRIQIGGDVSFLSMVRPIPTPHTHTAAVLTPLPHALRHHSPPCHATPPLPPLPRTARSSAICNTVKTATSSVVDQAMIHSSRNGSGEVK